MKIRLNKATLAAAELCAVKGGNRPFERHVMLEVQEGNPFNDISSLTIFASNGHYMYLANSDYTNLSGPQSEVKAVEIAIPKQVVKDAIRNSPKSLSEITLERILGNRYLLGNQMFEITEVAMPDYRNILHNLKLNGQNTVEAQFDADYLALGKKVIRKHYGITARLRPAHEIVLTQHGESASVMHCAGENDMIFLVMPTKLKTANPEELFSYLNFVPFKKIEKES